MLGATRYRVSFDTGSSMAYLHNGGPICGISMVRVHTKDKRVSPEMNGLGTDGGVPETCPGRRSHCIGVGALLCLGEGLTEGRLGRLAEVVEETEACSLRHD